MSAKSDAKTYLIRAEANLLNRDLAIKHWRKAQEIGIPDELIGASVLLGYKLGLDKELSHLSQRMYSLADKGKGGITRIEFKDVREMINKNRDRQIKLDKMYKKGETPIHPLVDLFHWSLTDLYHGFLNMKEADPAPGFQPPLFTRYGGRHILSDFPKEVPNWRLHIDITGLLLAEHLDVLELVEQTFKPLYIPDITINLLDKLISEVLPHQPSIIDAVQEVINYIENGKISTINIDVKRKSQNTKLIEERGERWVNLFETALENQGYMVEFLPLQKIDLFGEVEHLPDDIKQYLVSCRDVIEVLFKQGTLSGTKHKRIINQLGIEWSKPVSSTLPEKGSKLYLSVLIAETLAQAGAIQIVCDNYNVVIDEVEYKRLKDMQIEANRRIELADWLKNLRNRISSGIHNNKYKYITIEAKSEEKESVLKVSDCLDILQSFKPNDGDVIWVDDRCINKFLQNKNRVPLYGINEVLQSLVSAGVLSEADYYRKLIQLRAGNARYIPVQKGEIVHFLNEAKVEDESVVETTELKILRNYIAVCHLQEEYLDQPIYKDDQVKDYGEIPFLMDVNSAIIEAMAKLWVVEEFDQSEVEARCEWILNNLYIDHSGIKEVASIKTAEQNDMHLLVLNIARMLFEGFRLDWKTTDDEISTRNNYMKWLYNRIIRKYFNKEPKLTIPVADVLKKFMQEPPQSGVTEKYTDNESSEVMIYLMQKFYLDLPEPIKEELNKDDKFIKSIDIQLQERVGIGKFDFDAKEFYKTVSKVINGEEKTIKLVDSNVEVILKPSEKEDEKGTFYIVEQPDGKYHFVHREELKLLSTSSKEREDVLRDHRFWFDCEEEQLSEIIQDIISAEKPHERMKKLDRYRKPSAAYFYWDLYNSLNYKMMNRVSFDVNELVPTNAKGLIRHYRIPINIGSFESFTESLNGAASTLIKEEGLYAAFWRMSCLPVTIPDSIIIAIQELPKTDRDELVDKLVNIAASPIFSINLLHLLTKLPDDTGKYKELINKVISSLLDENSKLFIRSFKAVLNWASDEICYLFRDNKWSPQIKLAMTWGHAHKIYSMFKSLSAPDEWIKTTFENALREQINRRIPAEMIFREHKYWNDITHWRFVNSESFILMGLANSLKDYPESISDSIFSSQLLSLAFPEIEGTKSPAMGLLTDSSQAENSLNSFLGCDRGIKLSPLIGDEAANGYSSAMLHKFLDTALDKMENSNEDNSGWMNLLLVLGFLPPYKDIENQVKEVIRQVSFVDLLKDDYQNGFFAIQAVSEQLFNFSDEDLRNHVIEQFLELVRLLSEDESAFEASKSTVKGERHSFELIQILPDIALNIAYSVSPPDDPILEVSDILGKVIDINPNLIPNLRLLLQRFCEELPVHQSKKFWSLLLRLRAL